VVLKKRRSSVIPITEFDDIALLATMLSTFNPTSHSRQLTLRLACVPPRSSWRCHGTSRWDQSPESATSISRGYAQRYVGLLSGRADGQTM
jgi:hypothetical protein